MADDTDNPDDPVPSIFNTPKGGLFGGPFDPSGLDANVRAEIMDWRWTTVLGGSQAATKIPYAFPTEASDYTTVTGYPATAEIATFEPLGDIQKAAVRTTFNLVASYTDLTFVEVGSGLASAATFRFAQYDKPDLSESRFPSNPGPYDGGSDSRDAGDTFLGGNGDPPAAYFGTDDFATIVHEMGHAFGLKHGHDASFNGALAPQFNDSEFSVMTYASYSGRATPQRATAPIAGLGAAKLHDVRHRRPPGPLRRQLQQGRHRRALYLGSGDRPGDRSTAGPPPTPGRARPARSSRPYGRWAPSPPTT